MNTKQSWKALGTVLLVFLGGMAAVFASFAFGGFPFPGGSAAGIVWAELALLAVLLAVPLFRLFS